MTFKLSREAEQEALQLDGSQVGTHLYDTARPMKGWVQLPFAQSDKWKDFAVRALEDTDKRSKVAPPAARDGRDS